ncbi:MAG: hypothetical protein CMH22_15775 [Methylophaga sp.]|nr:hypothetical protein [Methylophaga sp.]
MSFAFSQRHTDFQDNCKLALFFRQGLSFWPHNSLKKKLLSLIIKKLELLKMNYKAACLIFIMWSVAS